MTVRRKKASLPGPALKRAVSAMLMAGLQIKHIEFRLDGTFIVVPRQRAIPNEVIAGTPDIARSLGVAAITVRRMAKDGRLKTFQTGSASSPLKVSRSEIDRVLGERTTPSGHKVNCDFHCDQVAAECTCGAVK